MFNSFSMCSCLKFEFASLLFCQLFVYLVPLELCFFNLYLMSSMCTIFASY